MSKISLNKLRCLKLLICVFLNILLMYSMSLCLYISGVSTCGVIESAEMTSYCILMLENIVCSLTVTVICIAFYLYNIRK